MTYHSFTLANRWIQPCSASSSPAHVERTLVLDFMAYLEPFSWLRTERGLIPGLRRVGSPSLGPVARELPHSFGQQRRLIPERDPQTLTGVVGGVAHRRPGLEIAVDRQPLGAGDEVVSEADEAGEVAAVLGLVVLEVERDLGDVEAAPGRELGQEDACDRQVAALRVEGAVGVRVIDIVVLGGRALDVVIAVPELLVDPPRCGSTSPRSAHGGQVAPVDPVAAIGWIRLARLLDTRTQAP